MRFRWPAPAVQSQCFRNKMTISLDQVGVAVRQFETRDSLNAEVQEIARIDIPEFLTFSDHDDGASADRARRHRALEQERRRILSNIRLPDARPKTAQTRGENVPSLSSS